MKHKWMAVISLMLLLQLAVFIVPAYALSVLSVSPSTVSNISAQTLTVSGSEFVNGAVVYLNANIPLSTSFVNADTLTAVLPQGFQAGIYNLTVTNPDNSSSSLSNALTVLDGITTPSPTVEDTRTATPIPAFARPVVVVSGYSSSPSPIVAGQSFTLNLTVTNQGQLTANNLLVNFAPGEMLPTGTGGVLTVGELKPGASRQLSQSFFASQSLAGMGLVPLEVRMAYTDLNNIAYNETFNVTLSMQAITYSGAAATATPTLTPTVSVNRPRLLVISSGTDQEVLKPGSQFSLELQIKNVGNEDARNVNMVVGGATLNPGSTDTPGDAGYSTSGGDFQNFSPLGSSNVQALGDIPVNAIFTASQALIVNVTTNPGAYPLKISFAFLNSKGETIIDDQVVTLLVQSPPMLDISFYRDPGPLFTYQSNILPIQVSNIGRKSAVLGNLTVTASNGMVENSQMQIGYLDPGGYLTLDAYLTPDLAGVVEVSITVDYIDDFNQLQSFSEVFPMEVIEMAPIDYPEEPYPDMGFEPAQENFWQMLWRFIRGLLGLDSGKPQQMMPEFYPMEEEIKTEGSGIAVPVPVKGP